MDAYLPNLYSGSIIIIPKFLAGSQSVITGLPTRCFINDNEPAGIGNRNHNTFSKPMALFHIRYHL